MLDTVRRGAELTVGSAEPGRSRQRSPVRSALLALAAAVCLIAAPLLVEALALAGAGDNILVPAEVRTVSTMGVIRRILRGPYPPEHEWFRSPTTVRLAAGRGTIEFDFGDPTRLAAVVLQAPPDDRYGVEASRDDGVTWQRIWNVESLPERGPVARNRQTRFDPPLVVTHLRLRNEAAQGTLSAISALRAYSTLPEGWPALTSLQSPSLHARYPWTGDIDAIYAAKFVVAALATLFLLACSPAVRRRLPERIVRWSRYAAVSASLVAGLGWWNLMQLTAHEPLGFYNYHDVFHYYMAGKYAPELGHTRLYDCYLAAEGEDRFGAYQLRRTRTRDLASDELVATSRRLAESSERCKPHFSPERWEDWKQDHAFFRTRMQPYFWVAMPMDHGFNGSPAWLILSRPLASLGPISDVSFYLLISADTLLFVLMWYVVWCSFGWRAACLGIVFWGTNYLAGNFFTCGSYLRHDWLFLTIAGICWVRQERMFLAGASLAYATTLRVFPAFVVLGLLLKIGYEMAHAGTLRLSKPHRQLIAGGVATTLLIAGLSVAVSGRATAWQEFAANSLKHQTTDKPQQVGLRSLLRYTEVYLEKISPGRNAERRRAEGIADSAESFHGPASRSGSWAPLLIRAALPALLLPLFLIAISKEQEWVAAVLGIGLIPLAGDISNYYCVILLAFAFLAVRSELAGFSFAALSLLLSGLCFWFGLFGSGEDRFTLLYPVGSVIVIAYVFWIVSLFALKSRVKLAENDVG